jgi:hypothetical protein
MFSPQSHQQFHLTWWCRILWFSLRGIINEKCLETLRSFSGKKKTVDQCLNPKVPQKNIAITSLVGDFNPS